VIKRYIETVDQKSLGMHVSVFISIKGWRRSRRREELKPLREKRSRTWKKPEGFMECY